MDDESLPKRPAPARDSLDILRRVEPVLWRVASDVVALRQEAADRTAAVNAGQIGQKTPGTPGTDDERPSLAADRLADTHNRLLDILEQVRDGQRRLAESQERIGLDQGRLAQGWARQEDGQEQLYAGQATLLDGHATLVDGIERAREELSGHDADASAAHKALAGHLQLLRHEQARMAEDQELYLEGQKMLGGMVARLDERLNRQLREIQALRRELRHLPVLWTLAALVFAAAGAMIVILRVRL